MDPGFARTMLGDTQVALPSYQATLGVTIDTAPAAIWPWLVPANTKIMSREAA